MSGRLLNSYDLTAYRAEMEDPARRAHWKRMARMMTLAPPEEGAKKRKRNLDPHAFDLRKRRMRARRIAKPWDPKAERSALRARRAQPLQQMWSTILNSHRRAGEARREARGQHLSILESFAAKNRIGEVMPGVPAIIAESLVPIPSISDAPGRDKEH